MRRLGRIAHPEMQWHQIVGTADTFGQENSNWPGEIPDLGEMEIGDLDRLCTLLTEHTADPDHCFFGLCEINHHPLVDKVASGASILPRLKLWRDAPSLIWPADRSWFVASEVDFDSTLVGGSHELVAAPVATPDLEVYEAAPDTKLTAFSDKLNPVPEPEP